MASERGKVAAQRLPAQERREQLTNVALEIAAERGYQGLELEEVAERAGVARSLLYRYFPEGRQDLYLAAADQAGRILAGDWVTDDSIPLGERLARNSRYIDHAAARRPSTPGASARARAVGGAELVAIGRRYHGVVLESISNRRRPRGAGYLLALHGYLAYAETTLDAWRDSDVRARRSPSCSHDPWWRRSKPPWRFRTEPAGRCGARRRPLIARSAAARCRCAGRRRWRRRRARSRPLRSAPGPARGRGTRPAPRPPARGS